MRQVRTILETSVYPSSKGWEGYTVQEIGSDVWNIKTEFKDRALRTYAQRVDYVEGMFLYNMLENTTIELVKVKGRPSEKAVRKQQKEACNKFLQMLNAQATAA